MKPIAHIAYIVSSIMLSSLLFAKDKEKPLRLSDLNVNYQFNEKDSTTYKVKESEVTINGTTYRQVEYQSNFFYLKLSSNLDVDISQEECLQRPKGPVPANIQIIFGKSAEKTKSSFFIEALSSRCGEILNWTVFLAKLKEFKIGINLPENESDTFHNKKIYVSPLMNSLNLQGDF